VDELNGLANRMATRAKSILSDYDPSTRADMLTAAACFRHLAREAPVVVDAP
jgi:hypothetical protein